MKKRPVTIKDIALELNISPSTVSRALSDNPLVKPETKQAVKALAKKHNYKPNFTALSLRSSETKTIGVIIPQLVHEFFAMVIRGIEDHCYSAGYNVLICSTHEEYEREVNDTKALITGRVDGLLACISKTTEKYDHFRECQERLIPLVFFDCICDEIETHKVIIDDLKAGYQATKHLIDQGAKNIGFIGGPESLPINQLRYAGYARALREADLCVDDKLVIHCQSGTFEDGLKKAKSLIIDNEDLDAIFATTDMLAVGALKNLKKLGKQVPNDVKIMGFSNWSISSLYEPSISTIDQPGYEMGQHAAELLIREIQDPTTNGYTTATLETCVIPRESTIGS